ncbi:MAG: hypothetical protein E7653_07065 [Ruminococcaceae bacterium]|nr:hypothetical protein [Oscillospiraceae bacterium]
MKNILKLMMALALVLCMVTALVACAGDDAPAAGDTPAADAGTPDATPEDPGNDTTGEDGTLPNKGANTGAGYGDLS